MDAAWSPLWLGLRAACLSTAIALALGPWLAFLLLGRPALGRTAWLPLTASTPLIAAYALLARPFAWPMAALAALPFSLPYLMRASAAAFTQLNPDYLNAARGLGASEWRVFARVAAPLARGPILGAAGFAFAGVATDYAALLILARALRAPAPPGIAPLSAVLIVGIAVHFLASRLAHRGTAA